MEKKCELNSTTTMKGKRGMIKRGVRALKIMRKPSNVRKVKRGLRTAGRIGKAMVKAANAKRGAGAMLRNW